MKNAMPKTFFTTPKLNAQNILCLYPVMSFCDSQTLKTLAKVNRTHHGAIDAYQKDKNRVFPIYPTLNQIADFRITPLPQIKASTLSGGLTNITYLLEISDNQQQQTQWALRIPGIGTSDFIDRELEAFIAKFTAALDINVSVIWSHQDGRQLSEFFTDAMALDSINDKTPYLPLVAKTFRFLHQQSRFDTEAYFNLDYWLEYQWVVKKDASFFNAQVMDMVSPFIYRLTSALSQYKFTQCIIHGDPIPGNFLIRLNKNAPMEARLIDWEYAKVLGDPLFDIAYFFVYGECDAEQREIVLKHYGETLTLAMKDRLTLYEPLICWWICLWAKVQLANNSESGERVEYIEMAQSYLSLTLTLVSSEDVLQALHRLAENAYQAESRATLTALSPIL